MARPLLVAGLAAVAAVGCTASDKTLTRGPLPACAGAASTVALGVGAYAAYDIASDSGCAVFPANASASDSAEYLVVVQAAGRIVAEVPRQEATQERLLRLMAGVDAAVAG